MEFEYHEQCGWCGAIFTDKAHHRCPNCKHEDPWWGWPPSKRFNKQTSLDDWGARGERLIVILSGAPPL